MRQKSDSEYSNQMCWSRETSEICGPGGSGPGSAGWRHMAEENAVRPPELGDDYELGCSADSPSCNILFTRVKHLWEARVRRNSTCQRRKSSTRAERRRRHGSLRIFVTKWTAVSTTDASFYSLSCSSLTAFPGSWSPWKPYFDCSLKTILEWRRGSRGVEM